MSKSFSNRSNANRYLAKMDNRDDFRVVPAGDRLEVVPVEAPAEVVSLDDAAAAGRDAYHDGANFDACPYTGIEAHAAWVDGYAQARNERLSACVDPAAVASLDGADAFFDGRNLSDCPHLKGKLAKAWRAAFSAAEVQARAEAGPEAEAEEKEAADAEAEARTHADPPPPAPVAEATARSLAVAPANVGPAVAEVEAPAVGGFMLQCFVSQAEADAVARFVATRFHRSVALTSPVSGQVVRTVGSDPVPVKAPRTPKAPGTGTPRAPKADPTVKPVITAASQGHMQAVFNKIEAARGDARALQALNTFKRSATYTKMAGRYLDALLAEAAAKAA